MTDFAAKTDHDLEAPTRAPWHLWALGVPHLIFAVFGVLSTCADRAGLLGDAGEGLSAQRQAILADMPIWMNAVTNVSVFGSFLAAFFLLRRSKLAPFLYTAAFLADLTGLGFSVAQGWFTQTNLNEIGFGIVVFSLGFLYMAYAWAMLREGVLR